MTTSSNFAYASLDDIVFEGRNHEYGAYLLRKLYPTNLWRGLVLAISLFMLLLSLPLIINKIWPESHIPAIIEEPDIPVTQVDVVLPKEEIKPPVEQVQQDVAPPSAATVRNTTPKIVAHPDPARQMPETLPPGIESGPTTTPGNGGTAVIPNPGNGTQIIEKPEPAPILDFAEVNPAFPGGEEALVKYLSSHIHYPSLAERNHLEGLVVVQFVVNEEGAISDMVVLKKLGAGTDEEAMRVIKNMPPWSPGRQNGRPVKVRFTLPIRFTLGR